MLRTIYLTMSAGCLLGYLGWSIMGMELGGRGRDPIPTVPSVSSSSGGVYGGSRSSGGFFGGGGGFGK